MPSTPSSHNSSPIEPLAAAVEAMNVQDPDNNAIYEEIDDDVVSECGKCRKK